MKVTGQRDTKKTMGLSYTLNFFCIAIQRPVYECKYAQGRIQKFDGVDRASGDKWRYGHHQIEMENPRENCAKECMKIKLRDDAVNSVMVREPGNTDTFDADLKFNCLCKRDGGLLKATNVGWKSCFLVPASMLILFLISLVKPQNLVPLFGSVVAISRTQKSYISSKCFKYVSFIE